MDAKLIIALLQAASAIASFLRGLMDDESRLQKIVDEARAGGREVGLDDVRAAISGMEGASDRLRNLLGGG